MIRTSKGLLISNFLLFSGVVYGIRSQNPIFIIISSLMLFGLFIITAEKKFALSLAGSFLLLYPGPTFGWLYARDSHISALKTTRIINNGWPVSQPALERGFLGTPLLHFLTISSHKITSLGIYPSKSGQVLITQLLPIVFCSIALLTSYLFIRRWVCSSKITLKVSLAFSPILFYIPLYRYKTGFARNSLAFALFILAVYSFYCWYSGTDDRRLWVIAGFLASCLVITHHFTSIMFVSFASIVLVCSLILGRRLEAISAFSLIFIYIIIFSIWYVFLYPDNTSFIRNILNSLTLFRLGSIFDFFQAGDPGNNTRNTVSNSLYNTYRIFFSRWIYQFVISLGVLYVFVKGATQKHFSTKEMVWYSSAVLFGLLIAIGALYGWLTHVIGFNRLFLFFIITSGGISTLGVHLHTNSERAVKVYVIVLVMISASTVPAYAISDEPPAPDQIDEYQQFPQTLYFTGDFVRKYSTSKMIVGDLNTYQIVSTMSLIPTVANIESFQSGDLPNGSSMVIRERNFDLYWGFTGSTGSFSFNPENLRLKLSKNNVDKVYSNGDSYVYTEK